MHTDLHVCTIIFTHALNYMHMEKIKAVMTYLRARVEELCEWKKGERRIQGQRKEKAQEKNTLKNERQDIYSFMLNYI